MTSLTENRNPYIIFIIIIILFLSINNVSARHKIRYGVWYIPSENTTINGISLGIFKWKKSKKTITNGLRFELIGTGIILPLIPSGPNNLSEKKFKKEFLDMSIMNLYMVLTYLYPVHM